MNNDQATNFRHYPRRHHPGPQPAGLAQLHRRSGRSGLVDLSICAVDGVGSQTERNRPEDWTMTTRREVSRRHRMATGARLRKAQATILEASPENPQEKKPPRTAIRKRHRRTHLYNTRLEAGSQ